MYFIALFIVFMFFVEFNRMLLIDDDGKQKLYITGDTLYNKKIFDDLPDDIYAVFLPINGVGNNMNIIDAKNFAKKTGAKWTVPVHFGMFDDIDPGDFNLENAIIPKLNEMGSVRKELS